MDQIPAHILSRLRFLAAKRTLSGVSTVDVVAFADQALAGGVYHDELLAILDARPQTEDEIGPRFQLLCESCQVPIDDGAWALQYLLEYYIARMALPNSDPDAEIVALMHAVGPEALAQIYKNQQSLGLERILLLAMQYNSFVQFHGVPPEELEAAQQACARLIPEMRAAAHVWRKRYGSLRDFPETQPELE